ncbi:ABC transporter ATP-binding protein [Pseudochrobactrum asaccharolyticum]|uniref:ABC transporter ATP-binding protein n=1 Tax=Pseudochrobactrum asaccharolyticum TaxID=354351 RepID=UPI0040415AA5
MAGVQLKNIEKTYEGGGRGVTGISLNIQHGEFIVLVGPSGCGKSTLLRVIAGLEQATGGELIINDKPANNLPPQARDIAMVFQNYALYPHMTVRQNITFGLELRGMPKAEREAKVQEVAQILHLTPYLDRKPAQLSGGQRQRVAMGRAISRQASVFLMDEPLSNLDAALRAEMRAEIKALHRRLGTTFIYVTHDQTEALSLADRVAVLNQGKLLQFDRPEVIYDRPVNTFVAEFLGSPQMNLLDAIHFPQDQLPVVGHTVSRIGIRPEAMELRNDTEAENGLHLPAEILAQELVGGQVILSVATPAGQMRVVVPRGADGKIQTGSYVYLPFIHLHLFDKNGDRIE